MKWLVSLAVAVLCTLAVMGFMYAVIHYPHVMTPIGIGMLGLAGFGVIATLVVAITEAIFG